MGNLLNHCHFIHGRQSWKGVGMRGVVAKRLRKHTVKLRQGLEPYPFQEPTVQQRKRKRSPGKNEKVKLGKMLFEPYIAFSGVYRQTYQGLKRFWKGLNSRQRAEF